MSAFDEWHTEEIENDLFNLEPIDIAERAFNARDDYIKNLKQELELMKAIRPSQQEIDELEAERDRLREALQNIANGDTPWMDGYSETPGEIYQKYAQQALKGG